MLAAGCQFQPEFHTRLLDAVSERWSLESSASVLPNYLRSSPHFSFGEIQG